MKDLEPYHPLPFLQLCSVVTRHLVIEESCLLTTGEGEDRTQMTRWNNLHADRERHWSGIGCLLLCTLLCTHIQSHGLLAYIPTIYIVRLYIQEVWLQQLHTNTGHNGVVVCLIWDTLYGHISQPLAVVSFLFGLWLYKYNVLLTSGPTIDRGSVMVATMSLATSIAS